MAASEQGIRENPHALRVNALRFLQSPRPLDAFMQMTNPELAPKFESMRIKATPGIGYCMDERKPLHGTAAEPLPQPLVEVSKPPKAAMVGGAAGWMMYFRMMGLDVPHAADATRQLYEKMGWGKMEVHNDDEHGHMHSPAEVAKNKKGCGALSVKDEAFAVVYDLLRDEMPGAISKVEKDASGEQYIEELVGRGADVVPLTGNHKTKDQDPSRNAAVVVNMQPGTTIDREAAYDTNPLFLWDAGSTTGTDVLAAFNRITDEQMVAQAGHHHSALTARHFVQIQAAMHLAVGDLLGASHLGTKGNVTVLK